MGRLVTVLVSIAIAIITAPAAADLTTGLIAHYTLDGHANDSSGNGNHGTPNANMVVTTDRFGTPSSAYEFNGTNSYITIPSSASLESPSTAITQAAWVNLYGASLVGQAFGPVLMKSTSTANAFMYRMIASPTGMGQAFNDWNQHVGTATTIALNEWHHVASTYDGAKHRFYLDGLPVDSIAQTITITQDNRDLVIGGDIPGILEVFYGKMDDVRIWNRQLTDDEIADLVGITVGVDDPAASLSFGIRRVYPMPANGAVSVVFALPEGGPVEVAIHDVAGRRVRGMALGVMSRGQHTLTWDGFADSGSRVGAGVYFVRVQAGDREAVARVVRW